MRNPPGTQAFNVLLAHVLFLTSFLIIALIPPGESGFLLAGQPRPLNLLDEGENVPALSSLDLALPSELPHLLKLWKTEHEDEFVLPTGFDSLHTDSASHAAARRLLPPNMSLMEKGMWGESGILRGIGIASPLTPEVRKSELTLRRTMLSVHQIGGFVTLGLMITTVYYGQQLLNAEMGISGNDPRDFRNLHSQFVTATIISYSATALLSILSPPPLIRREETSTTTIHKTLAWIHVAGMIITPIVGSMIYKGNRNGPSTFNENEAKFHQISAYVTTAALAASMIVVTF